MISNRSSTFCETIVIVRINLCFRKLCARLNAIRITKTKNETRTARSPRMIAGFVSVSGDKRFRCW